jgi:V8-like Glu-specific endopeptidase
MVDKAKSDGSERTDLPWNIDRFVSTDNTPDEEEPAELKELRIRSPRYITALKKGITPKLEKVGKDGTWVLELGDELMMGRPGHEMKMLPKADVKKGARAEIKPGIPKWSGMTYHTRVSAPREKRLLTRISGKKVTPHGYIFGADDRQVYYPSGYPWRCVGKVEVWYIVGSTWNYLGSGAGALVGDNIMVTASHMFPWFVGLFGWGWAMKFTPAYYDGVSTYGSGVYSWCEVGYGYSDHDQGDDMIVMKLYTPLGNSLGWFGSKTYNDDWEGGHYWTKCGYPGALASGNRPSRMMWFPIVDDDWDGAGLELEYKADSSGGDSGGPVFGWWDSGPHLVGVHSGGEEEYHFPWSIVKNNVAAGGSILPNLIIWAQNNW